jgi:hypothetical protein
MAVLRPIAQTNNTRSYSRGFHIVTRLLNDGVFRCKEEFATVPIGEPFLIRLDDVPVRRRIEESIQSVQIVEPELHDAIDFAQRKRLGTVTRDSGLDVAAHVSLGIRLAREERCVNTLSVLQILLVGHISPAANENV